MMAFIFLLLLISLLLAWSRRAKPARWLLVASLVVSTIWFLHHVTSHLTIQL